MKADAVHSCIYLDFTDIDKVLKKLIIVHTSARLNTLAHIVSILFIGECDIEERYDFWSMFKIYTEHIKYQHEPAGKSDKC